MDPAPPIEQVTPMDEGFRIEKSGGPASGSSSSSPEEAALSSSSSSAGDISVLRGRMNVRLDGHLVELEEGDSLFFEGDQGHVLENPGNVEVDYVVVIKY